MRWSTGTMANREVGIWASNGAKLFLTSAAAIALILPSGSRTVTASSGVCTQFVEASLRLGPNL